MRTGGISTLNIAYLLRDSITRSQLDLSKAQTELVSGRHADVGLTLGSGTGRDLLWRVEIGAMQQLADTNKLASVRADVSQSAMDAIRDLAGKFLATITGARNADHGQELAKTAARSALDQLTGLLNTAHDGQYLFGGTNTGTAPLADYAASPAKTSVDAAFAAAFGMSQDDPAVVNITAAGMAAFLDTQFAALFDPAGWSANWSSAADRPLMTRIDGNQRVQASTNANGEPFRQLAQALAMVAELGAPGLNQSAFETIVDKALSLTSGAIAGVGAEQSRLGLAQNDISAANERLGRRLGAVMATVRNVESVDNYEAATRVNALMTQLETSYTLTGRISRLSLLNYI
jgi:flagellar hook-associated protein 3 FlgL